MDIYTTPAMEAPEGKTSNLINPTSLMTTRIGLCSAALAVVLVFVSIRIYMRYLLKSFNFEDWVLIFATASFTALLSMLVIVSTYGDGKHLWDVSVAELYSTLYYENIAEILYCTTMFPIKFVLLHQIKFIFFSHDRGSPSHFVIVVLIIANFLVYTALGLAFIFACTPREKIYHPNIEGHCISATACMTAAAALNVASDVSILITPLFGIAKLNMPLKKKLMAASVFGVGLFAIAASCVRLYYGVELFFTEDSTWVFMGVGNWTAIEFMMGFVVAGAPYIPRFLQTVTGRKEQTPHAYSSRKLHVPHYAPKRFTPPNRPVGSSWVALGEQEDFMPFDGSLERLPNATHRGVV
ncbi:hypothetical protein J7T55_007169 [Diaporthe amygdali]|uniref:uncharacterized protein n=1 Tax=Phomopsis amygdali TaxID=1214568 RepID=UPI0022FE760F|nr:uncharacterized protein J7T55_007169 [Diaporthe amygdali]KAJ0108051.1 hypothetical protein J7T55_007169 [Diaporthe amygdali]